MAKQIAIVLGLRGAHAGDDVVLAQVQDSVGDASGFQSDLRADVRVGHCQAHVVVTFGTGIFAVHLEAEDARAVWMIFKQRADRVVGCDFGDVHPRRQYPLLENV